MNNNNNNISNPKNNIIFPGNNMNIEVDYAANYGKNLNFPPGGNNNNNINYNNNVYQNPQEINNQSIGSNLDNFLKQFPNIQNNLNNKNNIDINPDFRSKSDKEILGANNQQFPYNNNNNPYDIIGLNNNKNINNGNNNIMPDNNLNFMNNRLGQNNNNNINNFNDKNFINIENMGVKPDEAFIHNNNNMFNFKNDINNINNINRNSFNNANINKNISGFNDNRIETCTNCFGLQDLIYLECFHMICKKCLTSQAEADFNNVRCKVNDCQLPVNYQYMKMILGEDVLNKIESESMGRLLNEYGKQIVCPNNDCQELIFFEVGRVDYNIKNEKNQLISKQAAECYSQNRCKCPRCQKEFCISCNFSPFHLGKTCEEQRKFKEAKKCKYCQSEIKANNRGPSEDVCSAEDCVGANQIACTKKLLCGHPCYGTKFDKNCPPCLNKKCESYINYYDQDEDDYCNICFAEGLGSAPIILFKCNHYVHYKCADLCLKKKYIGPKITFNHMNCPRCKGQMDCPNTNPIQLQINENRQLYDNIVKMSLERLKFEGLEKDQQLTDPNSPFFNKPIDFALKKLSYYMCYECKKPYFAGLRDCRGGPDEDNNPNRQYDAKDLICGAHANIAGVAGITDCPKHGKDFIEYKCKFCCSIASWFCWGTTHFCEDCHARQCKGDYVSKYTKDKLPKCQGNAKCALKIKHPDNGEEYALGCSVCRNASENYKQF